MAHAGMVSHQGGVHGPRHRDARGSRGADRRFFRVVDRGAERPMVASIRHGHGRAAVSGFSS